MNRNFDFFRKITDVSEASFIKLQGLSTYRKFPAKTVLADASAVPTKVYMLVSGVIAAFVSSEKGKQFNKRLFTPISFVGALTAILKNEPSEVTYMTLTDCKMYEVEFDEFKQLCEQEFEIGIFYVKVLEHIFITYEARSLDLMRMDATEHYLKLRSQIPDVDNLIPQYQIASYLNITPVQLSRIRKKLNFI